MTDQRAVPVTITVKKTGGYRIEGEVSLVDHEGNPIPTTPGKPFTLCKCGASATLPFCDGTHKRIDCVVTAELPAESGPGPTSP